jgi:excisionase family DNA binding protein
MGAAEQVYTPEQVAEHLQVSLRTVMDYLRAGKLKGFKVGRLWRIKDSDLQAFIGGAPQRCVLCNNFISAAEISEAFEHALWEWGLRAGTTDDAGGAQPPAGANWNVIHTDRWGWVHNDCASAHGTGETPEARQQAFVEGVMRLLHGERGNTPGQGRGNGG